MIIQPSWNRPNHKSTTGKNSNKIKKRRKRRPKQTNKQIKNVEARGRKMGGN